MPGPTHQKPSEKALQGVWSILTYGQPALFLGYEKGCEPFEIIYCPYKKAKSVGSESIWSHPVAIQWVIPLEWLFNVGVYLVWLRHFYGKSLSECLRCGKRQSHKQQKNSPHGASKKL